MGAHDPRGVREMFVVLALAAAGLVLAAAVTLAPRLGGDRPQAPTVSVVDVIAPDRAPLP